MSFFTKWLPLVSFLAGGLSSGCGSSPEPVYYALSISPGAGPISGPHLVKIRRPGLAGYLDRAAIVTHVVDHRLGVTVGERWGEPLDQMLGRVLAEDLEARMPSSVFFTEDGAISSSPDATVEVNVERLEAGKDRDLVLVAQIAVASGPSLGEPPSRSVRLRAHAQGSDTASTVAAASLLVGQLADQVAELLHGLPPQPTVQSTVSAPHPRSERSSDELGADARGSAVVSD